MIGVIIQARTGSTRFPRKVLADLNGSPVIQHVIDRAQQWGQKVVLAVPYSDVGQFYQFNVPIHYGPEEDVLERFVGAADAFKFTRVMRITSDCPLLNPRLLEEVYKLSLRGCSYAAVGYPQGGWPMGWGCEFFPVRILLQAHDYAQDPYDREHVTPWMERHVRCKYLMNSKDESHLNYCVDTKEDLERLRALTARKDKDK